MIEARVRDFPQGQIDMLSGSVTASSELVSMLLKLNNGKVPLTRRAPIATRVDRKLGPHTERSGMKFSPDASRWLVIQLARDAERNYPEMAETEL